MGESTLSGIGKQVAKRRVHRAPVTLVVTGIRCPPGRFTHPDGFFGKAHSGAVMARQAPASCK